jgi:hypothetical protein
MPRSNRQLLEARKLGPYRLLVEGTDDQWSVINLMARHGIDWDAQAPPLPHVENSKGVHNVLGAIGVAVKTYERLGFIIDADIDRLNRWTQIRDRLRAHGASAPDHPDTNGTVIGGIKSSTSRIGVWLMPDNSNPGLLEHFLAQLVPSGDPCWQRAGEITSEARQLGAPLAEKDEPKGVIYTWLAWQKEPGLPFGTALKAKVLSHDSVEALRFVAWFKRLFLQSSA